MLFRSLKVGQQEDTVKLMETLSKYGFEHVEYVYEPGQFALRGSILVEIHSSRMDASREVIEDGESIFIVFMCYCPLFQVGTYPTRNFATLGPL